VAYLSTLDRGVKAESAVNAAVCDIPQVLPARSLKRSGLFAPEELAKIARRGIDGYLAPLGSLTMPWSRRPPMALAPQTLPLRIAIKILNSRTNYRRPSRRHEIAMHRAQIRREMQVVP
jgi:hypothetical protein